MIKTIQFRIWKNLYIQLYWHGLKDHRIWGYVHSIYYDAITYTALNLYIFSIQWTDRKVDDL